MKWKVKDPIDNEVKVFNSKQEAYDYLLWRKKVKASIITLEELYPGYKDAEEIEFI